MTLDLFVDVGITYAFIFSCTRLVLLNKKPKLILEHKGNEMKCLLVFTVILHSSNKLFQKFQPVRYLIRSSRRLIRQLRMTVYPGFSFKPRQNRGGKKENLTEHENGLKMKEGERRWMGAGG